MRIRCMALVVLLVSSWLHAQQSLVLVPGEPTNLYDAKQQLIQYQACQEANCYLPQLERQIDVAIRFLKKRVKAAKPGEKLALVLDIDETALSNWAVETHDDLGYVPADSNACIALQCGKKMAATLRLFHEAEEAKVAVFFISGRPEGQRVDTALNLKTEGYDRWEELYLRPANHPADQSVAAYKSGDRALIAAKGYTIVLNVGDQLSDLALDPQAELSVKLPNPFYFIP